MLFQVMGSKTKLKDSKQVRAFDGAADRNRAEIPNWIWTGASCVF